MNFRGNRKRVLTGTTLGFFFGFAAVALCGPTAIVFKEAMDLSPASLGLLIPIPALSGSLLQIPFGAWVDKKRNTLFQQLCTKIFRLAVFGAAK